MKTQKVTVDLTDMRSIKQGERKQNTLANKGYNLKKTEVGFTQVTFIYQLPC